MAASGLTKCSGPMFFFKFVLLLLCEEVIPKVCNGFLETPRIYVYIQLPYFIM